MKQIDIYNIVQNTVINFEPHFNIGKVELLSKFNSPNTEYFPMLYLETPVQSRLTDNTITYSCILYILDRVDIINQDLDQHKILNKTENLSLLVREYQINELKKYNISFNMISGVQTIRDFSEDLTGQRQTVEFTGPIEVYRCNLPNNTVNIINNNNCV